MYTRQNKTKKNQTQPQINDENGLCSILRKLPQFPLVFSPVSRFSPTGPEGTFLSGEGRWMVVGDQDPRFPLRPSPTALFLTSYSGFPCTNMPRSPSHPSSRGGSAGGRERWERARCLPAALVGRVAERALPLGSWPGPLPGEESCWLWGPA